MRLVLLTILMAIGAVPVGAHELRPAFLHMIETAPGEFDMAWKVPARGEFRLSLDVVLPDSCTDTKPQMTGIEDAAQITHRVLQCRGGLNGHDITIEGLSATYTDVLVRIERSDGTVQTGRLTPDSPDLQVTDAPGALQTAQTYFLLGVEHILFGIDHLLFVLALLLLIRNVRTLVATITAFTVAHSITLAAAALELTRVPQPPIEAVIALSIAVVAAEVVRADRGETDLSIRYPWLIAFAFGLLHGFGFGGALRDIGLPQKDVPVALLTFNLGVEAGQLIFVGSVLVTGLALRALLPVERMHLRFPSVYLIGCIAAFWFAERVSGFVFS
jgi:hydrogenase/urease accessory protein HupE